MAKRPRSDEVKRVEEEDGGALLNRSVIEAMLSQLGSTRNSAAVDRAQEIMFDAWETADSKKRVALAHKALAISPNCADAWVMLAEETADTAEEAIMLYAKAVAAGEKALGKAAFKEDVGMFWGLIETRPYMRARQGLAMAQWDGGLREEAAAGAWDMLRLNPNDNQGVRYLLLDWLVFLRRDGDIATLMKRYKNDGGAEWLWPAVLFAFRKSGDSAPARAVLKRAVAANRYMAAYLTGRKKIPRRQPEFVVVGSDDEAACCAAQTAPTWAETPGALAWLADQIGPSVPTRRRRTGPPLKPPPSA